MAFIVLPLSRASSLAGCRASAAVLLRRISTRSAARSAESPGAASPTDSGASASPTFDTSDDRKHIDSLIRVDHAGELGADRIYAGQMFVLGNSPVGPVIQKMWDQEKAHLKQFEALVDKHRVRPTALHPVWSAAGFALGAGTALLGKEAAMACTVAVETVIGEHYNDQLRGIIAKNDPKYDELKKTIKSFRDEELEHLNIGMEHKAEQAPLYQALSQTIQAGCRVAIWIAKRV